MIKTLNIEEQFIAYGFQKNTVIETGEEVYFIFFKSALWTHSAQMNKTEFDGIFHKVSYQTEKIKKTKTCIIENWKIIHAISNG